jgi:transposase-like protein
MNPQEQVCPNPKCCASGKDGQIGIHSRQDQRYRCKSCGRTFTVTVGTAYYRLKKSHEVFTLVVSLLAYGCPVQAIVVAFQIDERTVWRWLRQAGQHCEALHERIVSNGHLDLGQIQADELKVKTYTGTVWLGMVMQVKTRLWLGGSVHKQRGKSLLQRVLNYAERSGRGGAILIAVDGFNIYLEIIPLVFSQSWNWLQACWQGWREVVIVQTMKQRRGQRGRVQQQIASGTRQQVATMIQRSQGHGWINTAYIERLNATFRLRIASLVRSTRVLVRQPQTLIAWMWLVGCTYNFCTDHAGLRLPLPISERKRFWVRRTPAMAAALTDHRWTIAELLAFKRLPVGWSLSRLTQGAFPLPRSLA